MGFVEDMKCVVHRFILEYFGADFVCVCKSCSKARGQCEHQDDTSTTMEESNPIAVIENPEDGDSHLMERSCAMFTYFMQCLNDETKTQEYLSSLVEQISILVLGLMQQRIKNGELSFWINDQEPSGSPSPDRCTNRRAIPKPVDITLDVDTACNFLHLSEDGKSATWSFTSKNYPETHQRFTYRPQVLSSQSFSEGCHYWDVDVSRSDEWRVGFCYPSIERNGGRGSGLGNNKKSWCLTRSHDCYYVIHNRKKTPVPCFGDYVRISLDYKSGLISFHELGSPDQLLYTFTASFTEPLHAVLGVGRGCLKIPGGTSGGGRNFNEMGIQWNINPMG